MERLNDEQLNVLDKEILEFYCQEAAKRLEDYIVKKHSFNVHTAYIAEVKRSLGLPMFNAPNAVETLKNPRKQPTPIQVNAIKEALVHFEVI